MRRIALVVMLLSSSLVSAAESAKDHFERGRTLYDSTRYEAALREFEQAQAIQYSAALLYNMGRCLEHLGRNEEAVKAYSRYIDAEPSEQSDAQERIESLSAAPPSFPPPPSRRKWLLPGALGGGAVALLAVGTGLLGSAAVEYKHLKQTCSPGCAPSAWDGLQGRETAGWVLTGLAGVAVIVDVALIVRATRRK